jgi:polar amino acid transport system substrate-binding protein
MRLLPMILAALISSVVILAGPCRAQMPENVPGVPQRELVVGTKQTPPFAMKNADGSWSGISIDLWRHVADEQHLRYRFAEESTVQELLDGIENGKLDIAVAALTVTAARAQTLDFT